MVQSAADNRPLSEACRHAWQCHHGGKSLVGLRSSTSNMAYGEAQTAREATVSRIQDIGQQRQRKTLKWQPDVITSTATNIFLMAQSQPVLHARTHPVLAWTQNTTCCLSLDKRRPK